MSTALDIGPEQRQKYIEGALRCKPRQPLTVEQSARRREIIRSAQHAGELLKKQFGATRVVLFGSLAHGAWFAQDSDIDLAVEGLGPSDYWQAWAAVEALLSPSSVDLVDMGSCSDSLREAIERKGMAL